VQLPAVITVHTTRCAEEHPSSSSRSERHESRWGAGVNKKNEHKHAAGRFLDKAHSNLDVEDTYRTSMNVDMVPNAVAPQLLAAIEIGKDSC